MFLFGAKILFRNNKRLKCDEIIEIMLIHSVIHQIIEPIKYVNNPGSFRAILKSCRDYRESKHFRMC